MKKYILGILILSATIYALAQSFPPISAYVSSNGGATWNALSGGSGTPYPGTPPPAAIYASCNGNQWCPWTGSGSGGGIGGSGTTGDIPIFTSSSALGNSFINETTVANTDTFLGSNGIQIGNTPGGNLQTIFSNAGVNQYNANGSFILETSASNQTIWLRPGQTFSEALFTSGGVYFGTNAFTASDPGANIVQFQGAPEAGGTTFSVSGCGTATSLTGGAVAGSFVGGSATCTPVVTIGITAAHGYACHMNDFTTSTAAFRQTATSQTTATFTAGGTVGATDTINFFCMAY